MDREERITKVVISWFDTDENGKPILQTRKYNNIDKARAFEEKLPERNITEFTEKITNKIILK